MNDQKWQKENFNVVWHLDNIPCGITMTCSLQAKVICVPCAVSLLW